MQEALTSNPIKLDLVVHTWNPSLQKVETGGSEVHGHPLHGEFKASLERMTLCLNKRRKGKRGRRKRKKRKEKAEEDKKEEKEKNQQNNLEKEGILVSFLVAVTIYQAKAI